MDNFNILFLAGATSVVGLVATHQLTSSLYAQIKMNNKYNKSKIYECFM